MKHMRKLMALLMVVALVMAMSVTAMAAESNCSITINSNAPADSDVSGVKYYARKIFDAEFAPDYNGTIDDNTKITYSFPVSDTAVFNCINNWYSTDYFELTLSEDGQKYYVQLNDAGNSATGAELARVFHNIAWGDQAVSFTYNSNTKSYYAGDLEPGYYVICSSLGGNMIARTIGNVTLTQKNEYPTVELSAVSTVDNKNEVEFTLNIDMPPHGISGHQSANVVVELSVPEGIDIDLNSFSAKIEDSDFTAYYQETATGFTVSVDYKSLSQWQDKIINVTFKGNVDALADNPTITAKATLNEYTSAPSSVTISNGTVSVFKYTGDENNKTGLPGAGFVLKKTVKENDTDVTKYYKIDNDNKVTWVDTVTEASEYTTATANNCTISFIGLAEGTYTVVEKTVPGGYTQAQPEDVEIIVDSNGIASDASTQIVNVAGSLLPSTGGMGTTLFYILGGLMVVVALVVLVTNKRMRRT